ncbi:hypothetical protein [Aurantibacter sp.]|uniref:hypothetical protein n=1 Tax=Aurantibacter sp. TaxID=2807103 RepID=UPI0035C874E8
MKYILILLVSLSFSCKEEINKNDTLFVLKNNLQIKDSIQKLKLYNQKLGTLYLEKKENTTIITMTIVPNFPHTLNRDFDYSFIKLYDFPFLVYSKQINVSKIDSDIIKKELLQDSLINFNNRGLFTNYAYWKFMYCSDNPSKIECYQNNQIENFYQESQKTINTDNFILFEESSLYPDCD